jgi:hypothetical protein
MEPDRVSVVIISPSVVASMTLANTGFVLLRTMPSDVFAPRSDDLVKMLKDDLAHFASQPRRMHVHRPH